MGLKLIELQVALPRTQDVGKIQEQMQQRGQIEQEQLANDTKKEEIKKRQQVTTNEATFKSKQIKDDESSRQGNESQGRKGSKKKKKQQPAQPNHPYKGNFLDIEG